MEIALGLTVDFVRLADEATTVTIIPIGTTHIVLPGMNHLVDEDFLAVVLRHLGAAESDTDRVIRPVILSELPLAAVKTEPHHRELAIEVGGVILIELGHEEGGVGGKGVHFQSFNGSLFFFLSVWALLKSAAR